MAAVAILPLRRTGFQTRPSPPLGRIWRPVLLVFLFAGFLFFFRLGERDLTSSHEARAAQNAHMVLHEGCWDLPRLFDGRIELQKPPLYYWLVALLSCPGGAVTGWTVRLPAALSGLGCVGFVMFVGWRRGRALAGILAGLILASCLHFTWLARVGRIDMPLTLAVTVALGAFYLGRHEKATSWYLLAYVALALGVLLKGPIALALVIVVAVAQRLGVRQTGMSAPRSLLWGGLLLLLIAGPWFVWANWRTGNRLWEVFFWYHNVERGLGSATLASHPWWYYGPQLLLDLAPWSLLLPGACWYGWRKGWPNDPEARWAGIWFAAVTLFLSAMRFKRADYLLPAYPGAALFLGCMLERFWFAQQERRPWLAHAFCLTLGCYLSAWTVFLESQPRAGDMTYRQLAEDIRWRTSVPVIFFRVEAHALAFHVGRPLDTILEWENLEVWANQADPVYVVMSSECAASWREHLSCGHLDEVMRMPGTADGSERELVVMRSRVDLAKTIP